jgi:D-serine deaminase-like pyridoxal phosphate-dependent protein
MNIHDLDTPALLIDLDVMERNLRRMADYVRSHGLRLRPHTKTHKIPALGRQQLALGAVGLTVAKVSEAEVMLGAAPADLLVAYPVIGKQKLERLMQLAGQIQVTVSLDSAVAARELSAAASAADRNIRVLAEMDAGLRRVGVQPGEDLVALARCIDSLPGLSFEGIAFYPGHIKTMDATAHTALAKLGKVLDEAIRDLRAAGLEVKVISGGSTPTMYHSHEVSHLNEIRPGTYIFNDRNTVLCGAVNYDDCAASILLTVVSTAVKGQMIIDGGSKTFSSDRAASGTDEVSFGRLVDAPEAVFVKMNEEHGFVDLSNVSKQFQIGDRVRVIPNHVCVAMNLHEQVYGIRGEKVEQVWRVEGRGKLQ